MKRLSYIAPETEVITAYAQLLDDAVEDGAISLYGHTKDGGGNITYDYDSDVADGTDEVLSNQNMWGNLWED
ncbi:MAG: hypothetical protein IJV36_07610 [Prevotella sp.]|nr:hypothetical protein [Prevotella sp.]